MGTGISVLLHHLHNACLECQFCWGIKNEILMMWWLHDATFASLEESHRSQVEILSTIQMTKVWLLSSTREQLISHCIWPALTNWSRDSKWCRSSNRHFLLSSGYSWPLSRVTIPVEIPKELSSETVAIKTGENRVREVVSGSRVAKTYTKWPQFNSLPACPVCIVTISIK